MQNKNAHKTYEFIKSMQPSPTLLLSKHLDILYCEKTLSNFNQIAISSMINVHFYGVH
jgi:hypothetical protein